MKCYQSQTKSKKVNARYMETALKKIRSSNDERGDINLLAGPYDQANFVYEGGSDCGSNTTMAIDQHFIGQFDAIMLRKLTNYDPNSEQPIDGYMGINQFTYQCNEDFNKDKALDPECVCYEGSKKKWRWHTPPTPMLNAARAFTKRLNRLKHQTAIIGTGREFNKEKLLGFEIVNDPIMEIIRDSGVLVYDMSDILETMGHESNFRDTVHHNEGCQSTFAEAHVEVMQLQHFFMDLQDLIDEHKNVAALAPPKPKLIAAAKVKPHKTVDLQKAATPEEFAQRVNSITGADNREKQ